MRKIQRALVVLCAVIILGVATDTHAAEIGNTVWNDRNSNGVQDADEEGIPGVRIKIYNGNDVWKDTTNSQGRYKFKDLSAGHYTLIVAQETLPDGCYATHDRDGKNDGKYSDKYLKKNDYFTHADFGYNCPIKTHVVAGGQISPTTGPSIVVAIIAIALAIGMALFVYKRQGTRSVMKK